MEENFEVFAVYGFTLKYPSDWEIRFDRKLDRIEGSILFQSLDNKSLISLSWSLPDIKEGEGNSPSVMEGMKATVQRISKVRGVKTVTVVEDKEISINEHTGRFQRIHVKVATGSLLGGKVMGRNGIFAHFYCDKTERYFVLYGVPGEKDEEQSMVFNHMLDSIRCHGCTGG